jgi:hypothetical protein
MDTVALIARARGPRFLKGDLSHFQGPIPVDKSSVSIRKTEQARETKPKMPLPSFDCIFRKLQRVVCRTEENALCQK